MMPDSSSITHVFVEGQEVYPCRCGEAHKGPYAAEARRHHECFHNEPLAVPDKAYTQALCPACGKSFILEPLEQKEKALKKKLLAFRRILGRLVCLIIGVVPWYLLLIALVPDENDSAFFGIDVTRIEAFIYVMLAALGWSLPWVLLAVLPEEEP